MNNEQTDAEYFEYLKTIKDPKLLLEELLNHWHMFSGDSYYREYSDAFEKKP